MYFKPLKQYCSFIMFCHVFFSQSRTNIPKEVMSFPDFPFAKHLPSFVHHTEVRKYLEQYCDHFRLWDHIQVKKIILVVAQFLHFLNTLFLHVQHEERDIIIIDIIINYLTELLISLFMTSQST